MRCRLRPRSTKTSRATSNVGYQTNVVFEIRIFSAQFVYLFCAQLFIYLFCVVIKYFIWAYDKINSA